MSMLPRWCYAPVALLIIVSFFASPVLVMAENKNKGVKTKEALDATFTAIDIAVDAALAIAAAKAKSKEATAKTKSQTAQNSAVPTYDAAAYELLSGNFSSSQKTASATTQSQAKSKKDWAVYLYKTVLQSIAVTLLNKITEATVNWINTGFQGNPQYVQNPEQFFKNTGETYLKNIVDSIGYSSRFPYGRSIARALIMNYVDENKSIEDKLGFTLDQVVGSDWRNFQVDFSVGGWNAYNTYIGDQGNNPFDFFFGALEEAHNQMTNAQKKLDQELAQGRGFLNQKICVAERKGPAYDMNVEVGADPNNATVNSGTQADSQSINISGSGYDWTSGVGSGYSAPGNDHIETLGQGNGSGSGSSGSNNSGNGTGTYGTNYANNSNGAAPGSGTGECLRYKTVSPGAVVEQQLNRALESTKFGQSEFAAALGNSISNIVNALSNLLVTEGVSALGSATQGTGLNVSQNGISWSYDGLSLTGQQSDLTNTNTTDTTTPNNIWETPETTIDLYELLVTGPVLSTHMVTDANGVVSFQPDQYGDTVVTIAEKELAAYQAALALVDSVPQKLLDLDQCLPGPDKNWETRLTTKFDDVRSQLGSTLTAAGVSNTYSQSLVNYLDTIEQSMASLIQTQVNTYNIPGYAVMSTQLSPNLGMDEKKVVYQAKIADLTGIVNQLHSLASQVQAIGPSQDLTPDEAATLANLVNQYSAIQEDIPNNTTLSLAQTEKDQLQSSIDAVDSYLDTNNQNSCPSQKAVLANQHHFDFVVTDHGGRIGSIISGSLSAADQASLAGGAGITNLQGGEQVQVDHSYSSASTYHVVRPTTTSMIVPISTSQSQMISELSNSPFSAGSSNLNRLNALSAADLATVYSAIKGNDAHQYFPNVTNGPALVTKALDWFETEHGATPITVDMTTEPFFYCEQVLDGRDVQNLLRSWDINISCNDFYTSTIDDYQ